MTITRAGRCKGSRAVERRGRGRPQARSDEETRAVIYDAARNEFAGSGYAATSMESVAKRAGVSTKTLYRLIPEQGRVVRGDADEPHGPFRFGRAADAPATAATSRRRCARR